MDANTRIEKITLALNSLQDNVDVFRQHIDSLHEVIQNHPGNSGSDGVESDSELSQKFERISTNITNRYTHVENLVANMLHPDVIQNKIDHIQRIEERQNYWINKMSDTNGDK